MASTTDKIVTSKYQPKSTNVIWVDTSLNPPVEKHFINGRWVAVSGGGGGTKKYSDLEEKPLINGVELDGNKTSSDLGVATSQQGAKADTAYQKPLSGIPESDLSSDVQQALQKHFKGWYDDDINLPSNPVVGDYAYVKGAETTDPAAIYECTTDGSWSDSGRAADTSNVQTFASGEEVNEVYIDDTHLENPASGALAKAEDSMQLKYKLNGITAEVTKVTQTPVSGSYVKGTDGTIGTSNGYAYIETEVGSAHQVRFLGATWPNSTYTSGYAFGHYTDTSDPTTWVTDGCSAFDATGTTGVKEYILQVPFNATHFRTTTATSYTPTLGQNFYCYLYSGETVLNKMQEASICAFEYVQEAYISDSSIASAGSGSTNTYKVAYIKLYKGDIVKLRAIPRLIGSVPNIDFYQAVIKSCFTQQLPSVGVAVYNVVTHNPGTIVSSRKEIKATLTAEGDCYLCVYVPWVKDIATYDINTSTLITNKKDNQIGVCQGRVLRGYPDGDKKYVTSDYINGGVYFDLVCRDGYRINSVNLFDDSGNMICPNFLGEAACIGLHYRDRKGWGCMLPPHIKARVTVVKNSNGCIADEDCLVEERPIKSLTYLTNINGYSLDIPSTIEDAYPYVKYRAKSLVHVIGHYLRSKENFHPGSFPNTGNNYYNLADRTYFGVNYSDSRYIPSVVGQDVSIYTYLSALANKYSVVYTEDLNRKSSFYGMDYNLGRVSIQYFEMACNMFWGYCMGRHDMKKTSGILSGGDYNKIYDSANPVGMISDSVQTLDTLLMKGHVAFVLDVIKKNEDIMYIVVAESDTPFARINVFTKEDFDSYYMSNVGSVETPNYYALYRKNSSIGVSTYYQPFDNDNSEYVAHYEEEYPYIGSPQECMLYVGDRASLLIGSSVFVNVNRDTNKYTKVNIYKDNVLLQSIDITSLTSWANDPDGEDWVKVDLTSVVDGYGKYKAVASNSAGTVLSNETIWEMIDVTLSISGTTANFSISGGSPYIIQQEEPTSGFLAGKCDLLESTDTSHDISGFDTSNAKIALYAMGDYGVVKKVVDRD